MRKGGKIHRFLDEHIDWSRFDYTFVGRTAETFERIRLIPPVPSAEVAAHLLDHDIYVMPSRNDVCSNGLVEALTCGLPTLYVDSGGNPELVRDGGVRFTDESDVLAALERLASNYDLYARLVRPPSMDDVADRYLALIREVRQGEWTHRAQLDAVSGNSAPS
jgi:glycosyltransferase involved in cell wall biosynthesis